MWITTCISPAVLKDRGLKYVFRPQVHGGMFGELSVEFLHANAKEKLGVDPADLRIAIIHEDGPYGSGVASGNEGKAEVTRYERGVERRVCGNRIRPIGARDQAEARPAGCHPAHRVQPGHHPVLPPSQRARA